MTAVIARPASDLHTGNWHPTVGEPQFRVRSSTLYTEIDEAPPASDLDYVYLLLRQGLPESSRTMEVGLQFDDPPPTFAADKHYAVTTRVRLQFTLEPPTMGPRCHATVVVRVVSNGQTIVDRSTPVDVGGVVMFRDVDFLDEVPGCSIAANQLSLVIIPALDFAAERYVWCSWAAVEFAEKVTAKKRRK